MSGVLLFNDYLTFVEGKNINTEAESAVYFDNEERKIHDLINKERKRYKLDLLAWNSDLGNLARDYSKKMAKENFFSHYERNGKMVADRARAMKIVSWRKIGENLFMCQDCENISQISVKEWMKSPSHRSNILERRFNETGIGIAKSRNGTIYITQVFLQK